MKKLLTLLLMLFSIAAQSQEISIIPKPDSVLLKKGTTVIGYRTVYIMADEENKNAALFLQQYLKKNYGLSLKVIKPFSAKQANYIKLITRKFITAPQSDAYVLKVDKGIIEIEGDTYAGTFHGLQTLIQLLPVPKPKGQRHTFLSIPNVYITDAPRFSYRGIHFDVSRHFFDVSFVKQYIDYLALHKFNTFHWHLTDDQGWRIDIKKYPKLTSVGGWRNGTIIGRYPGKGNDSIRYGGYYTQEQIKEVVKYAANRFITVIPEIEMPGHASAAIAAYPELSCFPEEDTKIAKGTAWAGPTNGKQVQQAWGVFDDIFCAGKDETFHFLEGVLDEVVELFPSKYIHIGGDEAPKTHWKSCTKCQQRIKDLGLKDEHGLQSYFIQRMEKYLNSKGKQIIGWDEILEGGLAPNATVMSWQGEKGGIEAAKQKHDVVMTPGNWCYFDHSQSRNEDSVTFGAYTPIEEVYSYDPVPAQLNAEEAKHILGAQANLWTEYIKNTLKVEYQLFPRIAAMSEVVWTAKEKRDSADFERRLQQQFKRYDMWGVNYSKALYGIKDNIAPTKEFSGVIWNAYSKSSFKMMFELLPYSDSIQGWSVYPPLSAFNKIHTVPITIKESGLAVAVLMKDNGEVIDHLLRKISFNKATGKKITTSFPPSPAYPGNGGAFGLVNGVRADKFTSPEWLGWNGKEVEITIDLDKNDLVSEVILHAWKQEPSWIYLPESVDITFNYKDASGDIQTSGFEFEKPEEGWGEDRQLKFNFAPQRASTIIIKIKPLMKIPEGRQGAGRTAWVFLDEIEIN